MLGHPFTAPHPTSQRQLRRRITTLKDAQRRRIALVEQTKIDMDASVARAQLEITNLVAQVRIS